MKNPGNTMQIESRAVAARAQIMDVLAIFGSVGHLLTLAQLEGENARPELDGGVKNAVETTMINACARLDAILGDEDRWTLQDQDDMADSIRKSYAASAKMFAEQAALAKKTGAPHNAFRPAVVRMRPGFWLAISGSFKNLDSSICGVGESPAAALECFDAVFNGNLSKEQQNYIEALAHEKSLDQRGDSETDTVIDAETTADGDSPNSGPKPELGAGEDDQHGLTSESDEPGDSK